LSRALVLSSQAERDLRWWARTQVRVYRRTQALIVACLAEPFSGPGKPESLHGRPNTWSRRITREHRLVYRVFDDRIEILSARFHYGQ
jgi:toxin YoeB